VHLGCRVVDADWNGLKRGLVERTEAANLKVLDFDFFELPDTVTIVRSRKHIETFYDIKDIGKFP
jgi:hypothetical protein